MASVALDLAELAPDLELVLNVPGANAFPTVTEDEWVNRLRIGFWDAFNDGLIEEYTESEGIVTPRAGVTGVVMPRDQQQLILMYAAVAIVRQQLLNLKTLFRAKSGENEYETQQSATVLKALLDEFTSRRNYILQRLADQGIAMGMYYFDSYIARQNSYNQGLTAWIGS